jgi:choice-of-anchor C domain-containing protein
MKSILLLVVLFGLSVSQILNGGFEDNTCSNNAWCTYYGGEFCPSWSCTGSVDIHHNFLEQLYCYEGQFCVDVSGVNVGSASQTVSTVVGHSYTLSWYQSGNKNCDPVVKSMSVYATGNNAQTYYFDTTGITSLNMRWTLTSYSFVATQTSTTVTFTSNTYTSCGVVIDSVSLADTTPIDPFTHPSEFCANANRNLWGYGQGYYCANGAQGFLQCWESGNAYQGCSAGTSCQCPDGVECSNFGTQSPCA